VHKLAPPAAGSCHALQSRDAARELRAKAGPGYCQLVQ